MFLAMKNKLADKFTLLILATVVSIMLLLFYYYLDQAAVSKKTTNLISGCVLCITIFTYAVYDYLHKDKIKITSIAVVLWLIYVSAPTALVCFLYISGAIQVPDKFAHYIIINVVIVPAVFLLYKYSLGLLCRNKNKH